MKGETIVALISIAGTIGLGLLTFLRGTKSDKALDIATNVQNTYDAQRLLIDNLQEEVGRYQGLLSEQRQTIAGCEESCQRCRSELAEALRTIADRDDKIARLTRQVQRHEEKISAIARRTDGDPRNGDEERRSPAGG